jgi:hypothetical protein
MTSQHSSRPAGYHEGELAVQRRAGATRQAARLAGMLAPGELRGGLARFLAGRTFAALTARAPDGRLWVSPLSGSPGFLEVTGPTTLSVHAAPGPGDPLRELIAGQPAGIVVVEFATRRRVRINGTLSTVSPGRLGIDAEQAYGNCPQYIQQRLLTPATTVHHDSDSHRGNWLGHRDIALIGQADTFFIGTAHSTRGVRRLAPRRPGRVRPRPRRRVVVAGLRRQQHVQHPGEPRRRSRRGPAVPRLRHRAHAAAIRRGGHRVDSPRCPR